MKGFTTIIIALLLTSCKTVWKIPDVESYENNAPRIVSVAFLDTATVVEMEKSIGFGIRINNYAKLITNTMDTASLRWIDGLPLPDGQYNHASVRFQLGFAPINKSVKRLEFTEGIGTDAYRIWGIHPRGKKLVEYTYTPTRTPIKGEGIELLNELLAQHKGKNVMIQFVDMNNDDSFEMLKRSQAVHEMFHEDNRICFVHLAPPLPTEYKDGTGNAVILGKTVFFMEFLSPKEYETLFNLLRRYLSKDNVLFLDKNLHVLTPGLSYIYPYLFDKQLNCLK